MSRRARVPAARLLVLEITPMIDVVFLLIIFFMTTAQYARITRADVELPREAGEQQPIADEAGLVINLTASGGLVIQQREVSVVEIEEAVRATAAVEAEGRVADVRVTIRADRAADAVHLNALLKHLARLGVRSTRMATEVP